MQSIKKMISPTTVASAILSGFQPNDRRVMVEPKKKRQVGYTSSYRHRVAGCKGCKSLSVPQNRRAATKRANKRKNPRGSK